MRSYYHTTLMAILCMAAFVFVSCEDNDCPPCENKDHNSSADSGSCLEFKDMALLRYAMAWWDTNKDGCVSTDEANTVKEIPYRAFYKNNEVQSLDDLNQFKNLTVIREEAFAECPNLKTLQIPTLLQIEDSAFEKCTSLTSVDLPNVTTIGKAAFYGCTSLTSVDLPNVVDLADPSIVDNTLVGVFSRCTSLTSVNLPNVTTVKGWAFYECTSLTSVDLPNVTTIDEYAFYECTSLTSVDLPNVTTIDDGAFYGCTSLTSVNLPNVITIRDMVFGNTALTLIDLPNATNIDAYAFVNIDRTTKLTNLRLTTQRDIVFDIHNSDLQYGKGVTLTLHPNKQPGSTGSPSSDGNSWAGIEWKEIQYED